MIEIVQATRRHQRRLSIGARTTCAGCSPSSSPPSPPSSAASIGFQLGITSNIGAAGGTVVWHAGFPFFGWFFFPFLFFFLFIGLLAFAFGGRRRGWGGGPGWGNGYGPMSSDDPRRQWIADAHRRLHEEEARGPGRRRRPTTGRPAG